MGGRPFHDYWKKGHFQMIKKHGQRLYAKCLLCSRELRNTSRSRMRIHRNNCRPISAVHTNVRYIPESRLVKIMSSETIEESATDPAHDYGDDMSMEPTAEYELIEVVDSKEGILTSASHVINRNEEINEIVEECIDPDTTEIAVKIPDTPSQPLETRHILNLDHIHTSFVEFLTALAIPFNALDSPHLKQFIHSLNKSYQLPSLNELTTTYLDKIQQKHIPAIKGEESQSEQNVTLLLSGWKNFKSIVACLYKKPPNESSETRTFLNVWDLDLEFLGDDEHEIQQKIIENCCKIARERHNTKINAIVSDKKLYPSENLEIQQSLCHSFLSSCLADDIIEQNFAKLINQILQELVQNGCEQKIIDHGGGRLIFSAPDRWCTYRDSFQCYTKSNPIVRKLIDESKITLSFLVRGYIFNEILLEKIQKYTKILEPICQLIYLAQKKNSTHAELVEKWLELALPADCQDYLELRRDQALSPLAMTANYLHPIYRGRRLNAKQIEVVDFFLLESLDSAGLDQLLLYQRNENIFRILADKKITSYDTFWTMAERKCPELAKLAKRILSVPASVSFVDKIFSRWMAVNAGVKNFLGLEMFRKLTGLHFQLNLSKS